MSFKEEKERKSVLQEREGVVEGRDASGVLLSPAQPRVLAKPQGVSDEHQLDVAARTCPRQHASLAA